MEALKVLNKAKKFKQMDLKKSVVKGDLQCPLTLEELTEMRRRAEEERQRRALLQELEKKQKKEERLQKLRELYEQRRLEKQRQKEWLKPREDLLLIHEDSKVSLLSVDPNLITVTTATASLVPRLYPQPGNEARLLQSLIVTLVVPAPALYSEPAPS